MNLQWQIGRGMIALVFCGLIGSTMFALSVSRAAQTTTAAGVAHERRAENVQDAVATRNIQERRKQLCSVHAPMQTQLITPTY